MRCGDADVKGGDCNFIGSPQKNLQIMSFSPQPSTPALEAPFDDACRGLI